MWMKTSCWHQLGCRHSFAMCCGSVVKTCKPFVLCFLQRIGFVQTEPSCCQQEEREGGREGVCVCVCEGGRDLTQRETELL